MKYSLQYNQSLDASIFQILSEKCNNIHLHSDAQKLSMNLSAKILIQDIQFATKKATTCLLRNYLPIKKMAPFVRFDSYSCCPTSENPKKYIWMFAFSFISTYLWLCFDNAIDYVLIQVLIHKFSLNFLTCHTGAQKYFDCSNPSSWLKAYQ